MNRKAQRRAARAAAKMQMTLQKLADWQSHRELPKDFPVKSAEPEWSSKEQGLRIISVVERSGVLAHLEPKMTPRRGPKARASIRALLVCITMAACLKTKSYKRSDVVAVMYGLHPDIAQMLGLLDQHGNFKPIKFKRVAYQLIKFEALLWLGWYSGATRCDLRWFSNAMVWASVPRHIRRTVKAVIVDSTPVETWARTIHYVKQYDIDKDAFAMHREQVLENPNLAEPEPMDAMKAAAAKKRGVEVGPDGKIIRSKDLAARAGHASATRKRKAHKFVGYDLTTVIACRTISWSGRPDEYKLGPHVRPYILAIDLNPAGQNPGPSGLRAILNALKLAPGITEVIADRAYTVKREKFLRPLHKLGLNVVMDYPKRRLTNPDNETLGKRGQDVVMHCGTPLADWTPDTSVIPSAQNRRTTNTKQLENLFNKRFKEYGWRSAGPLYKPDGTIRGREFKCSVCAGCVASDFARRDPGSFRLHLRWLLALIMEAINDDIDTAEAEADADSRAEVRLVAADADGADLPGRRGSRGWGGPVGDHPAASSCPRWSDRGAAGVEAGPAASVSPGGVGGRGVAGRGRPAPGDGGRAGRRVGGAAGKIALGMSGPVPARVDGTAKAALLSLIDDAVDAGWTLNRACAVVELDRGRAWRWQQRRAGGGLDDARPGGNPIHGLLEWEEAEILALFDEWGDVDRSHRKLAHRGSYEQRVWASPSTVDRVLARHGLALQGAPRPARTVKTPWPDWCEWHPNQLWCWDGSQFERCVAAKHAYAIVDLVSRKWISTHLTANPDSVAARVLFSRGLDNEGLLTDELRARLTDPDTGLPDGDQAPLLLAVSDNGTEMHANETRRFMALCSIAQHFGRPSTPTDQAWIESLWGHVKREHPHLTTITDPAVLAAELERVRVHHNSVRLHEAIGYVTPNDEHDGRGDTIRAARTDGMRNADEQRRAWHRSQR